MKQVKAFTMIELIMVVIIIGILASIGSAVMFKVVERSRQAEALKFLGAVRRALLRYYAEHAVLLSNDLDMSFLDIAPPSNQGAKYFEFHLGDSSNTVQMDVCYADRNNVDLSYYQPYTIGVTINGDIENTSVL